MARLTYLWDRLELIIGGILAIIATCIVLYAVFMRYFLLRPPSWSLEFVIYLFFWCVFIMRSTLMRENGHIGADFFVSNLSPSNRRKIDFVTTAIGLVFETTLLVFGILLAVDAFDFGSRSATAIQFPLWIVMTAVPVGATLMFMRLIQRFYLLIKDPAEIGLGQDTPPS